MSLLIIHFIYIVAIAIPTKCSYQLFLNQHLFIITNVLKILTSLINDLCCTQFECRCELT